jgi:hypothetical protein
VGEKYDDCYEYEHEPFLRIDPRYRPLEAAAVPTDLLDRIRPWNAESQAALSTELGRPAETIQGTAEAGIRILREAGTDTAALTDAGRRAVATATSGYQEVDKQFREGGALLRELERDPRIPKEGLKDAALAGGRKATDTVSEHLSLFQAAINTTLGTVQDATVSALHSQAEAAVNRIAERAYANTNNLYRAVIQRGMADVPDEGPTGR